MSCHLTVEIVEKEIMSTNFVEVDPIKANITDKEIITNDFIEKEVVNVGVTDKEIIDVDITAIDILSIQDRAYIIYLINNYYKHGVSPTRLTVNQFEAPEAYVSGSLDVYLNGIKEKYIIEDSDTKFSFEIDTKSYDIIEICYLKK